MQLLFSKLLACVGADGWVDGWLDALLMFSLTVASLEFPGCLVNQKSNSFY